MRNGASVLSQWTSMARGKGKWEKIIFGKNRDHEKVST